MHIVKKINGKIFLLETKPFLLRTEKQSNHWQKNDWSKTTNKWSRKEDKQLKQSVGWPATLTDCVWFVPNRWSSMLLGGGLHWNGRLLRPVISNKDKETENTKQSLTDHFETEQTDWGNHSFWQSSPLPPPSQPPLFSITVAHDLLFASRTGRADDWKKRKTKNWSKRLIRRSSIWLWPNSFQWNFYW